MRLIKAAAALGVAFMLISCTKSAKPPTSARVAGTPPPSVLSELRAASSFQQATATPQAGGYIIADPAFTPLPGARALYGTLGGAAYEVEIPGNWNGELVLYEHGFTGNDPVLFVQPPPIRSHIIQAGFAWAASSFSASGYAPDVGLRDSLTLLDWFKNSIGVPTRTYIYGTSMGGHIVVSAMEQYPQLFDGALSECGVVMGEDEINYILSWVLLAQYLTGVQLYPITDANAYEAAVHSQVLPALGTPTSPTLVGRQFEDVIANLTGGPRPWREKGYLDRLGGNFDLPATEDPQHPSIPFLAASNVTVRYHIDPGLGLDDDTLNGGVLRVPGFGFARDPQQHPDYAPRTGRLQAPLLTIHTTGDHFVPISQEVAYRQLVDAAGDGGFLVQRAIRRPDHCQFSDAERIRAFDDLVNWVENGVQPAGDDFSSGDLRDVGLDFTTPLLPGDPGVE